MKAPSIISLISVPVFLLSPLNASAETTRCQQYYSESKTLGEFEVQKLTEAEMQAIELERPCMKGYPWPPGEFLVDDPIMGTAVTPERLREIRRTVDRISSSYRTKEQITRRIEQTYNEHELSVLMRLLQGMRPDLMKDYGVFLEMISLRNHQRFDEIRTLAESTLVTSAAVAAPFDEMESYTYYTKARLQNLFILLKFVALANMDADSTQKGIKQLEDFLEQRPNLAAEISILGDPAAPLLWNAGCYGS